MNNQPEFPSHRGKDSKCNGEPIVHDQFPESDLPADALNELKPLPEAPEPDFEVWVEGVGRFGIEVESGRYSVLRAT